MRSRGPKPDIPDGALNDGTNTSLCQPLDDQVSFRFVLSRGDYNELLIVWHELADHTANQHASNSVSAPISVEIRHRQSGLGAAQDALFAQSCEIGLGLYVRDEDARPIGVRVKAAGLPPELCGRH